MMLRTSVAVSGPEGETDVVMAGVREVTEVTEAGLTPEGAALLKGWVCCIFTVAFGKADPPPLEASGGRLMRAVSFFGEAGFETRPEAAGWAMPEGGAGGAGLSGTVGLAPLSGGGFGGGMAPLSGFKEGAPGGGMGGPGGRGAGGGTAPEAGKVTFEVSFFGACTAGCTPDSGMFTRTVSRLATGPSILDGSVIRMVSLFAGSS